MLTTPISQAFLQALEVRLWFEVAFLALFHQLGKPPLLNARPKEGTEVRLHGTAVSGREAGIRRPTEFVISRVMQDFGEDFDCLILCLSSPTADCYLCLREVSLASPDPLLGTLCVSQALTAGDP